VVLAARKLESLKTVEDRVRSEGGEALGVACHTGERSCFFRELPVKPSVKLSSDNPVRLTSIEKPGR